VLAKSQNLHCTNFTIEADFPLAMTMQNWAVPLIRSRQFSSQHDFGTFQATQVTPLVASWPPTSPSSVKDTTISLFSMSIGPYAVIAIGG